MYVEASTLRFIEVGHDMKLVFSSLNVSVVAYFKHALLVQFDVYSCINLVKV